jgi:D-lactate dehydrogenase
VELETAAAWEAAGASSRPIDRYGIAHDASHYRLVPALVSRPRSAEEVAAQLRLAAATRTHVAFRSAGTSLSGQAGTDGVLLDVRTHFAGVKVLDGGARVRLGPGTTLRLANAALSRHGTKLGPDPASEVACTVGGIVANNSSGMHCGTEQNSYRTIDSLTVVLADGTIIDTGNPDADSRLRALRPDLHRGLAELRDRIRARESVSAKIRAAFSMKNTMGYSMNAFLDYDEPAQILAHLMVGSEGTLGFVADVVFRTVPRFSHAATTLLLFPSIQDATDSLAHLDRHGAKTLELLDASALRVAQGIVSGSPDPAAAPLIETRIAEHAALLVEAAEPTPEALAAGRETLARGIADLPSLGSAPLTADPASRALLWKVRKGLYTAVAAARPAGTVALLEDIAVPVPALSSVCLQLEKLFAEHAYDFPVIFGHARDGNIHFLLNEDFDARGTERYERFTEDMVDLVLAKGGTLKAEHGTGRIMASFVRRQYGDELYGLMAEVKALFDPQGILAPGVLLEDDPGAYLRNLKPVPVVDPEVNACVECGYCEPACPSRTVTTTPRQRIALRREIRAALDEGRTELAESLAEDYAYEAVETCAADSLCKVNCPVLIDTGALMKRLRSESHGTAAHRIAEAASGHWKGISALARGAVGIASALPVPAVAAAAKAGRALLGADTVPAWTERLPAARASRSRAAGASVPAGEADAVFLPACINAIFGAERASAGVTAAFLLLCQRAGISVHVPAWIDEACCGTPFASKGFPAAAERMRRTVRERLRALLQEGSEGPLTVVVDASSCTHSYTDALSELPQVLVKDATTFARETLLPRLAVRHPLDAVVLHPTCASEHLGINGDMEHLARAFSDSVRTPDSWGCCGFAGDRGMLHPELTAAATAAEAREVAGLGCSNHASSNRTCELAMARATGRPYRHVLELLEEATWP